MDMATEQELVRSGGAGSLQHPVRSGLLPVPLGRVPHTALQGIAIYLRNWNSGSAEGDASGFALYRAPEVPFTAEDRQRLLDSGRRFVYIRIADQATYRNQVEKAVMEAVEDPKLAVAEKCSIVYETSIELVNELLADPDLIANSGRVETLSRSISTLVLNDPQAFAHLVAASHHDFYTATHMVNVATWMVPLAHALGYRDSEQLVRICQAGLLHDIGKVFVPEQVLNARGKLSPEQWQVIRQHPATGSAHLRTYAQIPELVVEVCRQHHERPDGSGYPDGLVGEQIGPVSRICAVVDCFDAMTGIRPFKRSALTISDAILELQAGTPHWYDREVVGTWVRLLRGVPDQVVQAGLVKEPQAAGRERRQNKRYKCDCPARINPLTRTSEGGLHEEAGIQVTIHSLSRFGLGVLSPTPIEVARPVRVYPLRKSWVGRFVHGHVVRCRSYRDGWFEMGIELQADGEEGREG